MGQHICDSRRRRSEIATQFPFLDLSLIPSGADTSWTPSREPKAQVAQRADEFLSWLAARPETELAVVSHSSFLLTLFNVVLAVDAEVSKSVCVC